MIQYLLMDILIVAAEYMSPSRSIDLM